MNSYCKNFLNLLTTESGKNIEIKIKKTFDFYATDSELGNYISSMLEVVEGDIDPQIEFDVESDD